MAPLGFNKMVDSILFLYEKYYFSIWWEENLAVKTQQTKEPKGWNMKGIENTIKKIRKKEPHKNSFI